MKMRPESALGHLPKGESSQRSREQVGAPLTKINMALLVKYRPGEGSRQRYISDLILWLSTRYA